VLQVQRILLEAFTNVLKHARATRIVMKARWHETGDERAVMIELADNGVGLPPAGDPAQPAAGHGVSNMQARAAAIGARLRVEPVPEGGSRVVIEWPIA